MHLLRTLCAGAATVALAGLLPVSQAPSPSPALAVAVARQATPVSAAAPLVLISPDARHAAAARPAPPTTAYCERHFKIACYRPRQILRAYGLLALFRAGITGRGQTIVIVDPYGSPTVRHDLAVFDAAAHLPAPPSLRIIQPAGRVPRYRPNANREAWAGETDLDVEYAHAVAPGARILLAETPTAENEGRSGFPQIVAAIRYVVRHRLGDVISQSFSATEQSFASPRRLLSLRGAYVAAARAGITVLSASGDSGAADVRYDGATYFLHPVTSWPDSDPLVTGVGGTQLHLNARGIQVRPATTWNDTGNVAANRYIIGNKGPNPLAGGGGRSVIFARPAYQAGVRAVTGARRGVPDISMSGACDGAADMYQSFAGQPKGWYPTCGTSEATPEFAGIIALAGQVAHRSLGPVNRSLYLLASLGARGIADVTSGNNTVSFRQGRQHALHTVRGFRARPGYDLASGLGTIRAPAFVRELAALGRRPHATRAQARSILARLRLRSAAAALAR